MTKKTLFHRLKSSLTTIIMIAAFFLGQNFAASANIDTETLIIGLDNIDTRIKSDKDNFNTMIKSFCDSMSSYQDEKYDSSQSLFLYYLCKNSESKFKSDKKGFSEDTKTSYTKFITDKDGNLINSMDQYLPSKYNETEDFIQKLFDSIIGSYTSIYQANIYGYINKPDSTIDDLINENFSSKYFSKKTGGMIEFCSTDKEYKYPKTCKKIKEYFQSAKNLITGNPENYLDDQQIQKQYNEDICEENSSDNKIPCGLYGSSIEGFINLSYNELMFYGLFIDYYSYILQNKSDFKNWNITDFDKKLATNRNRLQTMQNNLQASKEALQITIKMLKETQSTFPIHIGFLMYSEDIYRFTTSMNKALTPIYTLHDILRNVQKKE